MKSDARSLELPVSAVYLQEIDQEIDPAECSLHRGVLFSLCCRGEDNRNGFVFYTRVLMKKAKAAAKEIADEAIAAKL